MFAFLNKLRGGRRSSGTRARTRRPSVRKVAQSRQLELEGLEERMVLSPISDKYWSLGGPYGFLGNATSYEYDTARHDGRWQSFQGGTIYWSAPTGAHEVHGAILGEYTHLGWEMSFLGFPTTDETTTGKGDGRYNWFQGGLIMWSPATGAHELHGAILQEYGNIGWERSVLGYPTSDERDTARHDGRYNNFQYGNIYWSPATGAHEVHGAIWAEYSHLNWELGFLGFPVTDEYTTGKGDGRYNHFQGGTILWSPASGAHEVHGAIRDEYANLGWERSVLGYPTSDETDTARRDGRYNNFQYGNIYWSPATGAHEVHGAIWSEYIHLNWELGVLGFPTSDEKATAKDGRYNAFQYGYILWSAATGAHEIHGAILNEYATLGWQNGPLGFPTSDETDTARHDGRFNNFQYGNIYWSPATGAHEVHGAIWSEYTHLGWELSFLGFPTSDESDTYRHDGRYNTFQGGTIFWSPATGAHEVHGAILSKYASIGWEMSALGFPTSNETGLPDGVSRVSYFQNGLIYWSPETGALELRSLQNQMYVPTDQPQEDDWSCGPNSVSRVLRYYGIDASYYDVRNVQENDTDLESRFHMGSRPGSLLDTMRHWKPDSQRESRTSFNRVLQLLSEGRPVVALLGWGRDYTIGLGTVPDKLHYVVLTGFDLMAKTISYTNTNGEELQYSFQEFNDKWDWYSSGAKGAFLTGTLDVPERTILY
jgi:uncharacterized protein with LGFP repeats